MGLKENIKNKRLGLELTLEEVAKQVGVSKPTLQRYESGVISNIPSDKIEKLAIALKTTPGELMGWEENKKSPSDMLEEVRKNDPQMRIIHNMLLELSPDEMPMVKAYVQGVLDNRREKK